VGLIKVKERRLALSHVVANSFHRRNFQWPCRTN
jgi:hypothetical protein